MFIVEDLREKSIQAIKNYKSSINPLLKDKHCLHLMYMFLTILHCIIHKYKHINNFFIQKCSHFVILTFFPTVNVLEE